MWRNPQVSANLVTFTKEFLNEKPHFLCSVEDYLEVKKHLRHNVLAYTSFRKCRGLGISRGFIFAKRKRFYIKIQGQISNRTLILYFAVKN